MGRPSLDKGNPCKPIKELCLTALSQAKIWRCTCKALEGTTQRMTCFLRGETMLGLGCESKVQSQGQSEVLVAAD